MGEASRDTVAAPLLPPLILRGKLNLNGVIKDGYQVARGSSLKYCLQNRYQLRPPLPLRPPLSDFINLSGCRFAFAIGQLSGVAAGAERRTRGASWIHAFSMRT